MNEAYTPSPLDTSAVRLPEELTPLIERMARNVHEVWAQTRLQQGWTYGPERDDAKKKHPCLVPYDSLPEEERVYDRNTAVETLKLILSLGFDIDRRVTGDAGSAAEPSHGPGAASSQGGASSQNAASAGSATGESRRPLAESLALIDRIGQGIVRPKRRALCFWSTLYGVLTAGYVLYAALLCAHIGDAVRTVPMLVVITLVWGILTLLVCRVLRSCAEAVRKETERYNNLMNLLNERRVKLLDKEL